MRFLRKVRALRKPVIMGYTWLGYMHAMLKKKDIASIDIKAKMSYIGTLEDQVRMEVLEKQVEIMASMGDMLTKFNLEPDAWIDLVLRKYMHMPDDLVNALRTALPPEIAAQEAQQKKVRRASAPSANRARMREALSEIKATIEHKYGKSIVDDLHRMLNGDRVFTAPRRTLNELNRLQTLPPTDVHTHAQPLVETLRDKTVVSSFDLFENAVPTVNAAPSSATPAATSDEPAYRRYVGPART